MHTTALPFGSDLRIKAEKNLNRMKKPFEILFESFGKWKGCSLNRSTEVFCIENSIEIYRYAPQICKSKWLHFFTTLILFITRKMKALRFFFISKCEWILFPLSFKWLIVNIPPGPVIITLKSHNPVH